MDQPRYRLLIPPNGPSLRRDQVQSLQAHFDVVEGEEAARATPGEHDIVLCGPTDLAGVRTPVSALEEAAQGLVTLPSTAIESMNSVERLKWVEERLISLLRDRLNLRHFEVRLLNPRTEQLELVVVVGIKPLGVGKSLYAREGEGISGHVAVTGSTYLCRRVPDDPRYHPGLENAGSSVTVPLKLGGRVVGVMNVESQAEDAFSPTLVAAVELIATYTAIALHMLNLLVVERYTTRRQTAESLAEETGHALEEMLKHIAVLRETSELDAAGRAALDRIETGVSRIRESTRRCCAGPQGMLGVERAIYHAAAAHTLAGKRVIVVDDDGSVRELVVSVLSTAGCEVHACASGREAEQTILRMSQNGSAPGAIISDVRLPDLNGYEVFRMARESFPNLPVILMTGFGYDPHHSIVRASQEGLQSILFKPFKADQLLEEVARAVQTVGSGG